MPNWVGALLERELRHQKRDRLRRLNETALRSNEQIYHGKSRYEALRDRALIAWGFVFGATAIVFFFLGR